MNLAEIDPLALPSLPLLNRSQLPNLPAIYFVITDEQVIYIGRTSNLRQRWVDHHLLKQKALGEILVKVAWLSCSDINLLPSIELALIEYFQPCLNRCGLGRRENPDYSRVTGLVNRELAKRLRVYVAESESTISEVVEKALKKYLDEVQDT
jgi:GIY-YIG catalytic domain